MAALNQWDLSGAEAGFVAASGAGAGFALADLRLAQVRNWSDQAAAAWMTLVTRALRRSTDLTDTDLTEVSGSRARRG